MNLKGLEYEYIPVHIAKGEHKLPEYAAISADLLVPTLEIDGRRLGQSLAIIEYLDETHPKPPLLPGDAFARARIRARARAELGTDALEADGRGPQRFCRRVEVADVQPGDGLVYGAGAKVGHCAIVVARPAVVRRFADVTVMHCHGPSGTGPAITRASGALWDRKGGIAIRRVGPNCRRRRLSCRASISAPRTMYRSERGTFLTLSRRLASFRATNTSLASAS